MTKIKTTISMVQQHKYLWILLLLCTVMYLPTINYPFIWDDQELIAQNAFLENFNNITNVFSTGYLDAISDNNRNYPWYRPISTAFLLVEHRLFGNQSTGYHIVHNAIHLVCVLMLFRLLCSIFKQSPLWQFSQTNAFFSTLIFTTTPFSVDAVLFLSNIGDLLVLFWTLLAIRLIHNAKAQQHRGKRFIKQSGIFIISLAAMLSKESGIALPIVVAVMEWRLSANKSAKQSAITFGSGIIAAAVYGTMRYHVLSAVADPSISQLLLTFPGHVLFAMRWSLYPHPLAQMEPVPAIAPAIGWGVLLACVAAIIMWQRRSKFDPTGAVLWLAMISPALAGVDELRIFSPRYLYVPFLGISFLLVQFHSRLRPLVQNLLFIVPLILLLFSLIRIHAWQSPMTFWALEYERHPDNPLTLVHFADQLSDKGKSDQSRLLLFKAADIARKNKLKKIESLALRQIGKYYQTQNDVPRALQLYHMSVKVMPTSTVWLRIGDIHAINRKHFHDALLAYKQAELLFPNRFEVLLALSDAYAGLKMFDKSLIYIKKARQLYGSAPTKRKEIEKQLQRISTYKRQLSSPK
ncbi:MAG: hypothetical protein JXX14_24945 [Deltaproteobacteria bacterium]|nr:hypothetical protein [Deltaproteobacteria bacterium]